MCGAYWEKREYHRYGSMEKVVLVANGAPMLAIVRNFSKGGLFLSVIGSNRTITDDRIDVVLGAKKVRCLILHKDSQGLHCQFHRAVKQGAQPSSSSRPAAHTVVDNRPLRSAPATPNAIVLPVAVDRVDTYVEGWNTAIAQLDDTDDEVKVTIDVMTADLGPADKERWTAGFTDALNHKRRIDSLPS